MFRKRNEESIVEKLAIDGGTPVRKNALQYGHQFIDEEDVKAVVRILNSSNLTCGPAIDIAEKKLCELTGAKYAVLVSNGTAALHLACMAAGISDGDEVITTPITFAASANFLLYCGGRPIFADIDPHTYNISPSEIAGNITSNTKAVVAVDFTGQAVELDPIKKICEENGLCLIEDASHSIGTKYNGRYVGSIADMTTFSFHPVKTVTSGEGGAILTNSKEYYNRLKLLRGHGITRDESMMEGVSQGGWYYEQIALGYNYRITDIQAALLCSQLEKLQDFARRRKEIVIKYNEAFRNIPQLIVQQEIEQSDTVRHLYIIQLVLEQLQVGRKEVYDALEKEGVKCNVHYIPVYYFPYYQKLGYKKGICPNAEHLYERILTLPLFYSMSDEDVNDVIRAVKKVIEAYKIR